MRNFCVHSLQFYTLCATHKNVGLIDSPFIHTLHIRRGGQSKHTQPTALLKSIKIPIKIALTGYFSEYFPHECSRLRLRGRVSE